MKIKIRDLKPNPFRDMKNYPIDEHKVDNLANSINETGFWDNILTRNNVTETNPGGEVQLAYGHHRWLALRKAMRPEDEVDIPIKSLSDEQMLKIMAEENNDYYTTNVAVMNETIRQVWNYLVTKLFLKKVTLYETKAKGGTARPRWEFSEELDIPSPVSRKRPEAKESEHVYHKSPLAWQLAWWMGKNWGETKIYDLLQRLELLGLIEDKKTGKKEKPKLDKEAVELTSTPTVAKYFTDAVKKHDIPISVQKEAVKEIIKSEDFSKDSVEFQLLDAKHGFSEKEKKEKTFENFIESCANDARRLADKIDDLIEFGSDFDSGYYKDRLERFFFDSAVDLLLIKINKLRGNKNEKKEKTEKALPESL